MRLPVVVFGMTPETPAASPNAHFLIGEVPSPHTFDRAGWEGTGVSIAVHAIVLGLMLYGASHAPQVVHTVTSAADGFIFFDRPAPTPGKGGGGHDDQPVERPRKAEIAPTPPRDFTPAARPADVPPAPEMHVAIATPEAMRTLPGAIADLATTVGSAGPGGRGSGVGTGDGPGVGPGSLGGFGGDVFEPGAYVTSPQLIKEVRPRYTGDAMRAKIQGTVQMIAVVLSDGAVDPKSVRVTRSLDAVLGLDEQAILAVREWRFRPGLRNGRPVAVRINVELTFTIR